MVMLGLYMCAPSCGYVGSLHVCSNRVVMLDLYMCASSCGLQRTWALLVCSMPH